MNPYEVLGVEHDADADEIKKRYRKLARETHPDVNPGDKVAEERFKQVSIAYDILSDTERRAAFDEFGEVSLEAGFDAERAREARDQFANRFGRHDPTGRAQQFEFGDLDDLLRQFGGRARGRSGGAGPFGWSDLEMRGHDAEARLELDFADAIRGGERPLTIQRARADGEVFAESIRVRIPPGADAGSRLRIAGKGGQGIGGGPDGDLYVRIDVRPHPFLRRAGRNLEIDLPLTIAEATLGTEVEIPTLDSRVTLKVPPGTSSHKRLRIRGHGVPASGKKEAGDLYARIKIVAPRDVSDDARAVLEAIGQDDPREGLWS